MPEEKADKTIKYWGLLYEMIENFHKYGGLRIVILYELKDKPLIENKNHKFMAILPAHNEENVIGNLIESLKNQDYPKELLDIYVIAHNCTDNTAKIAKEDFRGSESSPIKTSFLISRPT